MPKTITINIVEISNGWLVSTPGTYAESDETNLYEDRQQPVTFYPDYDCVVAAMPDIARDALRNEQDAQDRRRAENERYRGGEKQAYPGEPISSGGVAGGEGVAVNAEKPEEPEVDQTDQQQPVPDEEVENLEDAESRIDTSEGSGNTAEDQRRDNA